MPFLQDFIHKFEEGGGMRYVRWGVMALLLLALIVVYNLRAFRNFNTLEAMDSAQLARNLSEGKGYTTSFVRPLSIYLLKKRNIAERRNLSDLAQLKTNHPDVSNPPVYPVVVAGLMKVLPFDFTVHTAKRFWGNNGFFYRYQPDFLISLFNQFLFFTLLVLVFRLAYRLFDRQVAWVSVLALLGSELLWRFCVSGLSTIFLMLVFVALVWTLVAREEAGRTETTTGAKLVWLGALAGALVGLGTLTRYSFFLLIAPVVAYLALFGGRLRAQTTLAAVAAFVLVVVPWLTRNYMVCGNPFGTAFYAFISNHPLMFNGARLERSLEPRLLVPLLWEASWHKIFVNLRPIFANDLPKLGGTWVTAFFLVGLMIGFHREGTRRLRYFVLACIPLFILAQTLGRTHLSDDSPELNTENLFVILTPFVVVYGVSLFFLLLDRIPLPVVELRYAVIGIFLLLVCMPMVLVFFPPRIMPVSYPPYDPAIIQFAATETRENELTMSDMPWAMAWYGRRQSVWLTHSPTPSADDPTNQEHLLAIHDYLKPISALYVSPLTIDRKFLSDWFKSGDRAWGGFIMSILINRRVPEIFPLRNPSDMFVFDSRFTSSKTTRDLELKLNRKIELVETAAQEMLSDPKLFEALKDSPKSKTFFELAEHREFPLGRVPTASGEAMEAMVGRGHLILTAWDRRPTQRPVGQ